MSTEHKERDEDAQLVELIQKGDLGAYRQLVEKYQSRIYSMIAGMVRDREEAHDLTQDAFVKAFRNLERFRLEASFYTWLYRIAKNLTIDWLRKQKRRRTDEFDEGIAARESGGTIADSHLKESPEGSWSVSRLKESNLEAMETLTPEHRQIILLEVKVLLQGNPGCDGNPGGDRRESLVLCPSQTSGDFEGEMEEVV